MATITSAGTGNSNATATWVGGVVPDADDDVVIDSGHTVTQNANATFNSLALNGTFVASSSYSLTIDGENSSGQAFIANSGTFTHGNGTVTITTPAATNIHFKTENPLNNLIINHSSAVVNLAGNPDDLKCEGDLTITAGTLQSTNSGATLEVDGDASVTGTLNWSGTSGGAVELGSLTINSGGTYSATSGTTTMTSKNSSNYIMDLDGTFTHNNGTVRINSTGSGDQLVDLIPSSGTLYNLEINENSSQAIQYNGNTTIANNLTIVEGIFQFYDNTNSNLTVTGDVDIENGGQLAASGWRGAGEFGGIRINSGGTYNATSGTTTVTNRFTGTSNLWKNDGGTFNHNNGTVKFTDNDHSLVKELTFYNLEQASSLGDYALSWETQSGTACTILGNLTITRGDFEINAAGNTLDIHGQTILNGSSDTGARFNNDKNQTGTITHHGIVTINGGTYHVEDGATVNMAGIRNLGGVVD